MKKDFVVLVNQSGRRIGILEKMKAHRLGQLHRAYSIFIFNDAGEMLIQKRARGKYHFAGLWSNACCSHPRPGEKINASAKRRLKEELGIELPLKNFGHMVYSFTDRKSKLMEHEWDCILTGKYNGEIPFSKSEVSKIKWIKVADLMREMKHKPGRFTPWFLLAVLDKKLNIPG